MKDRIKTNTINVVNELLIEQILTELILCTYNSVKSLESINLIFILPSEVGAITIPFAERRKLSLFG